MTLFLNGHNPSPKTVFSHRQSVLPDKYAAPQSFPAVPVVSASAMPRRPAGVVAPPAASAAFVQVTSGSAGGLAAWPGASQSRGGAVSAVLGDGERPTERGWQDKGARGLAPKASPQPAPVTKGARSSPVDTPPVRSQNPHSREKLERASVWMRPGVKLTLRDLAKKAELSFSATCAQGLEVYARAKIRDQEETLFEPRMQAMMRREIRASDNRHIYFEMRNAIAAEQTRILTTDLYKRQLQKEGVLLKEINQKLDDAYNMARDNILRKARTPQLKNLLAAWWRSTEEQADGSHKENTHTGAAVLGKREA